MVAGNNKPRSLFTSNYRAYDPTGTFKEIVQLTADAKKRFEDKGWTFQRTTASENYSR